MRREREVEVCNSERIRSNEKIRNMEGCEDEREEKANHNNMDVQN